MLEAIVLAGSPNEGLLQECSTAPKEALIRIAGRHMVEYVVEALDRTDEIDTIIVVGVGPEDLRYKVSKPVRWAPGGGDILTSLGQGLQAAFSDRVIVVTGDIPLINAAVVKSFLRQCGDRKADIYYPVISRDDSENSFPGVQRTYATLREGSFTGGNMFILNPAIVTRCYNQIRQGTELRKSPWRLCRLLGIGFLCKYLCRSLSLEELELKVMQLFSLEAKIVVSHHPEIGVDVDKPGDLRIVEAVLSRRGY